MKGFDPLQMLTSIISVAAVCLESADKNISFIR